MKKIFVTGGTGFLGRHLVPKLLNEGYYLKILTRTPKKHAWLAQYDNLEVIQGDLRSGDGLQAIAGCEYIVHAAGLFSMWSLAGDFTSTNVIGTEKLLNCAVQSGVKRLIYISTIAVIGNPQPNTIIDEKHPPRPADPYQASKLQAEQIVRDFHDSTQIETIILRPGAFYGPLGDYAFNRLFFTDPMRGLTMQVDGGNYVIFPVYIKDVAQGIHRALVDGRSGEIYNICDDPIRHRDAFDVIYQHANLKFPRWYVPGLVVIPFARILTWLSRYTRREPFYPISMKSYVFNDWHVTSAKAQDELGFVPTPFTQGAQETIRWYRAGRPDTLD